MTSAIRESLPPGRGVRSRKYLGPAREALKAMYQRKNREVLGSAGKARDPRSDRGEIRP